jgi:formate-dependent nitrite reductase cytochrome c552 subunit
MKNVVEHKADDILNMLMEIESLANKNKIPTTFYDKYVIRGHSKNVIPIGFHVGKIVCSNNHAEYYYYFRYSFVQDMNIKFSTSMSISVENIKKLIDDYVYDSILGRV